MRILILFLLLLIKSNCFSQTIYIDSTTKIQVIFISEKNMFPESWTIAPINGKAVSLDTSEYERSKKIVSLALSKYPLEILTKNLKKIYVLNDLHFYGVNYGGTVFNDAVYLTNKGLDKNYTDLYVEQLFHEEFSSVLLRNYASNINETKWKICASDSISYSGTGVDAIRNGKAGEDFDSLLNENGFLGEYATSNFENDFNSFAKNIFCPKPEFWNLINQYERIECKLNMIIDFYTKIDSKMDLEYFMKWVE